MNIYLIIGFTLGITSSLHCIGMCGPLVMNIPVNRTNLKSKLLGNLVYHFGRFASYMLLGSVIGLIGFSLRLFGWLQGLTILSGIVIIVLAWKQFLPIKFTSPGVYSIFGRAMRFLRDIKGTKKLFFLGSLNGMLPCGMVFAALTNAILAENLSMSVLAMLLFGLGTLPSLVIFNLLAGKFAFQLNKKFIPVLVSLIGILIVLRGLNLGIPYLSPELKTTVIQEQKCDVTMSCCHK